MKRPRIGRLRWCRCSLAAVARQEWNRVCRLHGSSAKAKEYQCGLIDGRAEIVALLESPEAIELMSAALRDSDTGVDVRAAVFALVERVVEDVAKW